jgi:Bacterial Ig-like domain (group 3)/FG-GAP-like repeat/FG-GAP repeat
MLSAKALLSTLCGVRSLLVLLIALLISASASAQTPIFPTTNLSPVAQSASSAAGDFNGDGQPDLAFISTSGMTATVLLSQGATTPAISVVTNPLNCDPTTLIAADMNVDKKLDLVLTCSSGYVVVMFGNGDGTFQTPAYYAVSVSASTGSAVSVDLNGDGYPDIALIGAQGTTTPPIAVLLNQGNSSPGTLAAPKFYPTINNASSIQVGDFNGDGKQDLLTWGSTLAVAYGNGDGTLQAQQAVQTPGGAGSFLAVDVNQDGITDIAYLTAPPSSTQVNPSIQILLGSSSGQFTTGSNLPLAIYTPTTSVVPTLGTAFKTNSGTVDLFLFVDGHTSILNGDGKGNFVLGQSYPFNGATSVIGSDGAADLLVSGGGILTTLHGNGDGTFSGLPTTEPVPGASIAADVNGDGLTDVLSVNGTGVLSTSLGRGNGTFTVVNQVPTGAQFGYVFLTGDFNSDGNVDFAKITYGNGVGHGDTTQQDSELILLTGNGDGTFQPAKAGVDLQVVEAVSAVVGDFNGDGFLDVIAAYTNAYDVPPPGSGLVFVPGKGDGTFGSAIPFSQNSSLTGGPVLTADLNNDKKLDLIWNSAVYLGNGDGTFRQIPLGLTGTPLAIGDLNGDGFADLVIGTNIYAGNGDGTFQTSPFYTFPLGSPSSISIGDLNSDGHPDVVFQNGLQAIVYLGDGKGHFTTNGMFYTGAPTSGAGVISTPALARLNNQAPALPNDNALDYLAFTAGGATSLLNLTNPTPATPAPLPSKTSLTLSASSAAPGQQLTVTATVTGASPTGSVSFISSGTTLGTSPVSNGVATLQFSLPTTGNFSITATYAGDTNNTSSTSNAVPLSIALVQSTTSLAVSATNANLNQHLNLTATVTGVNPTGSVTFVSGTTTLGTATVSNGTATLPFSFTVAGTYAAVANYAGDSANLASTSNSVSVVVIAPDFTISASPSSATITAGQSATTTLTVTPIGGYSGTLHFSCGTLPAGVACTFTPSSLTPNGAATTVGLTVSTTAPGGSAQRTLDRGLSAIAWAGVIFIAFSPKRMWRMNQLLKHSCLLLLLIGALVSLSGCSSGSSPNPPNNNPGTPTGAQTIAITVADSSSNLSHPINFQVTVQ